MGLERCSPLVLAHNRFMSFWGVGWDTEGNAFFPLGLFLTIDPGWTEGQWAGDQCISTDIDGELGQDLGRCRDRKGAGGAAKSGGGLLGPRGRGRAQECPPGIEGSV